MFSGWSLISGYRVETPSVYLPLLPHSGIMITSDMHTETKHILIALLQQGWTMMYKLIWLLNA